MTDQLKIRLKAFTYFTEAELNHIVAAFKPQKAKKNSTLLQEGDTCREFYFINNGCIRTYFIDNKGCEKTRYVVTENQFGTVLKSFITQTQSVEFIETLEDTAFLSIRYQDFFRLTKELENWNAFYQIILERAYSFQNRKIEALMTQTAKQRYEDFQKREPGLIQILSNKVLASYLDMREETLSRLK